MGDTQGATIWLNQSVLILDLPKLNNLAAEVNNKTSPPNPEVDLGKKEIMFIFNCFLFYGLVNVKLF